MGDGFLRYGDDQIVSAALHTDLNPDAPTVILVGRGPRRESSAQLLCEQRLPVAVYLKRGTNRWEFSGDFVVDRWSEAEAEIRKPMPASFEDAFDSKQNVEKIGILA